MLNLLQFKCVSKSWLSLISYEEFINLHLSLAISDLNTNHFRILTMSPFKSLDYESPSSLEDHVDDDSAIVDLLYPSMDHQELESNNVEIIGSCNGLICLLLYNTNKISLWNPSTRVSRDLPSLTCNFHDDCPIFNGFGYDWINNTYKVVRGTSNGIVDVFSTSGERWRRINQGFKDTSIIFDDQEQGVFFNGTLHWLGYYNDINEIKKEKTIVTFDLGQEIFGVMKQPMLEHDENVNFHNVGVLKGCLSLINKGNGLYCEIWVMKEYGVISSWMKLLVLDTNDFEHIGYVDPICFTKNGELIVDNEGYQLVRYNIEKKTCQTLKNHNDDWFQQIVYVQSLVSPYGNVIF
nr:F-box/kelch-repeat protein At3g06240-like [Solanum lycopersicum]